MRWVLVFAVVAAIMRIGGCMERMFYVPTAGVVNKPGVVPRVEDVWFNSADGTRLHGWFFPAAGARTHDHADDGRGGAGGAGGAGNGAATILHVHGNAGNIESHYWFTEYLPQASPLGFNVFIFDYRGYGQSEGSARRRADLIADTHAALDALLLRDDVDPRRIGMYGQSLGGSIALNAMADRDEIRAAVIESAFTSWREIAANVLGGDAPGPISRFLTWVFIGDRSRPIDAIARIDRPILILHGDADSIIPISHGRRLALAAKNAELVELSGGEHNTLRDSHPQIEERVIEFFRLHLR